MSVDDVMDILAIPLMGTIPDDEAIVISTNQENPGRYEYANPDKHIWTSAGGLMERRSLCMHRGRTGLLHIGFRTFKACIGEVAMKRNRCTYETVREIAIRRLEITACSR